MWTLKQSTLQGDWGPITYFLSDFVIDTLQLSVKLFFHLRKVNEYILKNDNQVFPWQILSFCWKLENTLTMKCHIDVLLVDPGITAYKEKGSETQNSWVKDTAKQPCVSWSWKPKIVWVWASSGDTFMNISLNDHFFLWNSLRRLFIYLFIFFCSHWVNCWPERL